VAGAAVYGITAQRDIAASSDYVGQASIIDGDTLEVHGRRIRLFGIDAPESGQTCKDSQGADYTCGQRAALALTDLIGARVVTCNQLDTDVYGRAVSICAVGGLDINGAMVEAGHAVAYREFSHAYIANEERAKAAKRGLWTGAFEMPAAFRQPTVIPLVGPSQVEPPTFPRVGDQDCAHFATRAQAQAFFQVQGPGDPHRLDADHDGLACETLP
jgi:endonuclease YncB( thermonuclease family)